ncbi:N-acetylmuramic acid 6-phosphate etherase [Camelliibacillus cellulosilyticus]|uniref:N-acetylmuramic acid 6-phosphate etherase n=1 Tax=Camelliibacillus cellulosilyticus TaxID=2174486 RepID=A0ABV9GSZ3_9BACL
MHSHLEPLTTERPNETTRDLSRLSTFEIAKRINDEDKKVADAVEKALPSITQSIDIITDAIEKGGRLFYFGAGTSGRLGVLDASECPPTFGTDPDLIKGMIAGGLTALTTAIEDAEDKTELGKKDVEDCEITAKDVVVGIAASGRTPYVIGALEEARLRTAKTIALTCNPDPEMSHYADVAINVVVGPEVVTGSTRLKAGTAQKMVLNMLTTGAMIRLGKVYGNLMVNVKATNEKLRERVNRIVMDITGVDREQAREIVGAAKGDARIAILMHTFNLNIEEARKALEVANDNFPRAMEYLRKKA